MTRFSNRVALVTGGASGLGKAIADRLAADGARVVISDVQRELGEAAASSCGALFVHHDVCEESEWSAVIRWIEEQAGPLTILINNAGIVGEMGAANPEYTRLEDWRRLFRVNVDSVFLGCKAGITAMRRAGNGSIINISSVAGLLATPGATAYGAGKAAVRQLTKSVAQYCAQERLNIRCNSVHPGNVRTPLWENAMRELASTRGLAVEELIEQVRAGSPLGEFTTPEDVAAMVSFLASDESRNITGARFTVDGGVVDCDTFGRSSVHSRPLTPGRALPAKNSQ